MKLIRSVLICLLFGLTISACRSTATANTPVSPEPATTEWFSMELTDVQMVVGIFALSFTVGEAFSQLWVFLWFGLGSGVPLLMLSLLSGALQRQLTAVFARNSRIVNFIGGLLLVGIAVYDVIKNWGLLRLFFG